MPSKLVNDRNKSGILVLASLVENKAFLMEKLAEYPGFPPEVVAAIIDVLHGRLEIAGGTMISADRANLVELDDDAPFREQRDESGAKARNVLCELRETLGFVYGEKTKRDLGLEEIPSTDPSLIHSLGGDVLERMSKWTQPATSRIESYTFDKDGWTTKLTGPLELLGSALKSLASEKREADTTQLAKNQAIAENDRIFSLTANLLSTLLEAAGNKELARRVRPSTRHPGQTIEAAADAESTPADPPADG